MNQRAGPATITAAVVGICLLFVARFPLVLVSTILILALGYGFLRKTQPIHWGSCCILILTGIAILAPFISDFNPFTRFEEQANHIMGLDPVGRDLFARILFGNRNSIAIAAAGSLGASLLGLLFGGLLGLAPKPVKGFLRNGIQAFLAIPPLIYFLLGLTLLPPGGTTLMILLAVTLWPELARLVQARIDLLKGADFMATARMGGGSELKLFLKEILPGLKGVVAVNFVVVFTGSVILESSLSYLGLGLPLGTPSLGHLIEEGLRQVEHFPLMLPTALGILLAWISGLRSVALLLEDSHQFRIMRPPTD